MRFFNDILAKIKEKHASHYLWDQNINSHTRLVVLIILLVIAGQITLTLYLPSMPHMASYFKTSGLNIRFSIILYLLGYGVSQFFYGPLSDIWGRRWIILSGLSIFILASLICLIASSLDIFLLGRILQGMGIGCGDTMGRAILCDRFKANKFISAACQIGFAAALTPVIAPLLGGYIENYLGWQGNFLIILLFAVIIFINIFFYLPETKPISLNSHINIIQLLKKYYVILTNRIFLGFFIPGAVCFVGESLFNMCSPFLLQKELHWGPIEFGWLNIFPATGLLIGAYAAHFLGKKYAYRKMVYIGLIVLTLSSFFLLLPSLFYVMNTLSILFPMFFFMIGIGIIYPNTNMGALIPFSASAGTAGALQGGLQMLSGGVLGSYISVFPTHSQLALALSLSLLSIAGLACFVVLLPSKDFVSTPE